MIQPNEEGDDSFAMERICDPFSTAPNYNYAPGDCPQDSIQIHDLPNVSVLICFLQFHGLRFQIQFLIRNSKNVFFSLFLECVYADSINPNL